MPNAKSGTLVRVSREPQIEYPEMYLSVYISGPPEDQIGFAEMFTRCYCTKAETPKDADLVVFTGGSDVDPQLYSGKPIHSSVNVDHQRDQDDALLYNYCKTNGIPMTGICRGMQFIHVMQGGRLYQDVDNHYGEHSMFDFLGRRIIRRISSVHHQLIFDEKDLDGYDPVAWSNNQSQVRWKDATSCSTGGNHRDVEAAMYSNDILAFCVQGHPEYSGFGEYTKWYLTQLARLFQEHPDILPVNGKYRDRRVVDTTTEKENTECAD